MKQLARLTATAVFLVASFGAAAEIATIEYVEGWVDLRYPGGDTVEAMIGDGLNKDDTVITGDDGTATLTRDGAAEIVINSNSVFSLREVDSGGEKETVMHTALGSVKFRFLKLFGKEPRISTPSTVAGVRGTEFTVYAGDEGSTLFTVDSGEVMVTSQGVPVILYEGEGVEVKAGRAPGAKFQKKGRPIDFSEWAAEKQEEFSADPIAGLKGIERQMDEYIREVGNLAAALESTRSQIQSYRNEYQQMINEAGKEIADAFYSSEIKPIEREITPIVQNLRYFALSAFSLKRYVLSKQFTLIKANRLIGKIDENSYTSFTQSMNRIVSNFRASVETFLVVYDI